MLKIAVLFGGCSNEYSVSLQSAHAVISNLDRTKYTPILVGITKCGHWLRYTGNIGKIAADTWHEDDENCVPVVLSHRRDSHILLELGDGTFTETEIDAVFPVLHGKNGEDGSVQGMLELAGIPVIGCKTLASALCMDKDRAHKLAAHAGIKVPASVTLTAADDRTKLTELTDGLNYPLFIKPCRSGSSIGITRAVDASALAQAVEIAFAVDDFVIIEEAIPGFEVGCAVMGNDELTIGEVDEIELAGGFFDFTEKYSLMTSAIHMPARIAADKAAEIRETAGRIYRALGCSVFARVDMFLTPDGEIVFNEVNTIPGFTAHSRFPNMMKGIGIEFPELLDRLVAFGLEDGAK